MPLLFRAGLLVLGYLQATVRAVLRTTRIKYPSYDNHNAAYDTDST